MTTTPQRLQQFVNYRKQYLRGDEKGEAQVFLDRFFRAFGHEGAIEAGAVYEDRVAKATKKGKTGFADLVWKPRLLIEMKKRGEDLAKHYDQAWDYWMRLVPDRPRYVMLCNFDEFWIYDFNTQLDTPIDLVRLEELPERAGTFGFMEVRERKSVFNNNQVAVTESAARRMAQLLNLLKARKVAEPVAQRFVLQCVLAMFAEDLGLLPPTVFVGCVQDCLGGQSAYDVLGGLFQEMNRPGITAGGRVPGVGYFNGGVFATIYLLELRPEELRLLESAALENWSKVRPAIFGSLFEGTMDEQARHAHGVHFTSETDIRQIVRPTIGRFWEERIEGAGSVKELNGLLLALQGYRVLDPACGSGNFLYIAYQELKRIEKLLLDKISEQGKGTAQVGLGFVTPQQFFGIDLNPFAVELARVTLMIGRKMAIDRLELTEPSLPLDTLDANIICADALFTEWPKADAVIGNPPFLGGARMRLELGDSYVAGVRAKFTEAKDKIDFCTYWFRLAHDHIGESGRAGLVATNSISQGKSRIASLDYIINNGGFIHEAIASQPWSGDANVYVSIVNWSKREPKNFYLNNASCLQINSSLKSEIDVTHAVRLKANLNICFKGVQPTGKGFFVSEKQAEEWARDSKNEELLKLFLDADDLASRTNGLPSRWIIDFNNKQIEEASSYKLPFNHVHNTVRLERKDNRDEHAKNYWWQFPRPRPAMREQLSLLQFYLAVPRHSKWFVFLPSKLEWLPGDSVVVVALDDFYILGIITSNLHRTWVKAQSSTLGETTRYTHNTCFETFPFPQTATPPQVQAIRDTITALHEYRTQRMTAKQYGITDLYNEFFHEPASQLHKLHAQLDALVLKAYGFTAQDDLLEKLLTLNLELAQREKDGLSVIGPWVPTVTIKTHP
ncbi:DNA methyltransferase [Candidatus Cyanaurora vandensis]|uniref:DNA methyltransferase n=1 Tax=Candidatus Cyanaurora vandensis TaxID=2714958 RepID=UPI00257FE528|nr:DNA methyltransferase [Candidatus Cyanaurora vandensis]